MIEFESSGSFDKTESFLTKMSKGDIFQALDKYGQMGVLALSGATPVDTGASAASWSYEVKRSVGSYSISWTNGHMVAGVPLVILLQYGHGTGTGGYVSGRDFINPAIRPVFDKIAEDVWKAVTSA